MLKAYTMTDECRKSWTKLQKKENQEEGDAQESREEKGGKEKGIEKESVGQQGRVRSHAVNLEDCGK